MPAYASRGAALPGASRTALARYLPPAAGWEPQRIWAARIRINRNVVACLL
jgi:hypothetical protein